MGCDIHGLVERKVKDKWVMVNRINYGTPAKERNYERFADLAGVRGVSDKFPIGLPDDISDSGRLYADEWGIDGHSHSNISIKEAAPIFVRTTRSLSSYARDYPCAHFFDVDDDAPLDEYRLVFWFDN